MQLIFCVLEAIIASRETTPKIHCVFLFFVVHFDSTDSAFLHCNAIDYNQTICAADVSTQRSMNSQTTFNFSSYFFLVRRKCTTEFCARQKRAWVYIVSVSSQRFFLFPCRSLHRKLLHTHIAYVPKPNTCVWHAAADIYSYAQAQFDFLNVTNAKRIKIKMTQISCATERRKTKTKMNR